MNHTYTYHVVEGNARSVGKKEAQLLKQTKPDNIPFFTSLFEGKKERFTEAEALFRMNETWCPGLNDEIEGFAEELGVSPESVVWYTATIPRSSNCSQFAILPDRSAAGTVICGRSYEWSLEDELTLRTIRIKGRYAHTGFSVFVFGRLDGLNEAGLWVSMTAGNPGPNLPQNRGFRFWALVRTILDRAATVKEAVEIASSFPLAFEVTLLTADKSGHAALIEKGPDYQSIARADSGVLFSTNHFTLPGVRERQPEIHRHSQLRSQYLAGALARGGLSSESAERILRAPFPDGLVTHYFSEWFGTLWSMYADLSTGALKVCFGPPDLTGNEYRAFSPSDPAGTQSFPVEIPEATAPAGTWVLIPR
ncbi:MAG TPA: hypothetical protein ENN69_08355 [Spirochaetia bacterium]|nr:hypothetical protein [Spirochaetia bacterium]